MFAEFLPNNFINFNMLVKYQNANTVPDKTPFSAFLMKHKLHQQNC